MSQEHLADAEDVDAAVDGLGGVPLGADGLLASPGLGAIDDVIMNQGAGVEHLTNHGNTLLQLSNSGAILSKVTVDC